MGKKLDFSQLADSFEKGVDFELTAEEYEQKIGRKLPKGNNYIKSKSPLSKEAASKGYKIEVVEEPVIRRKLIFSKNRKEH